MTPPHHDDSYNHRFGPTGSARSTINAHVALSAVTARGGKVVLGPPRTLLPARVNSGPRTTAAATATSGHTDCGQPVTTSLRPHAGQRTTVSTCRRRSARRCWPAWWPLLLVVLIVCGVSLLASGSASAQVVLAQPASVDAVLTNIRNWIMGILALLATVFLTVGGVRYVMAAGDPGEVEAAKRAFKSAGFGYALAALAPLLVQVLRGIVGT